MPKLHTLNAQGKVHPVPRRAARLVENPLVDGNVRSVLYHSLGTGRINQARRRPRDWIATLAEAPDLVPNPRQGLVDGGYGHWTYSRQGASCRMDRQVDCLGSSVRSNKE